jgi:hypothetical protein
MCAKHDSRVLRSSFALFCSCPKHSPTGCHRLPFSSLPKSLSVADGSSKHRPLSLMTACTLHLNIPTHDPPFPLSPHHLAAALAILPPRPKAAAHPWWPCSAQALSRAWTPASGFALLPHSSRRSHFLGLPSQLCPLKALFLRYPSASGPQLTSGFVPPWEICALPSTKERGEAWVCQTVAASVLLHVCSQSGTPLQSDAWWTTLCPYTQLRYIPSLSTGSVFNTVPTWGHYLISRLLQLTEISSCSLGEAEPQGQDSVGLCSPSIYNRSPWQAPRKHCKWNECALCVWLSSNEMNFQEKLFLQYWLRLKPKLNVDRN